MNDNNYTFSPLPSSLQNGRIQTIYEKSVTVIIFISIYFNFICNLKKNSYFLSFFENKIFYNIY